MSAAESRPAASGREWSAADPDTIAEFRAQLAAQGFTAEVKSMEPFRFIPDHTHDSEISGLVTSGEISISVGDETRRYRTGDIFTMCYGQVHRESVGPHGVSFVVGRRRP